MERRRVKTFLKLDLKVTPCIYFRIIAVNYPARDKGVTRQMRGDDAKQKCPDIVLARVPQVRGKADLTKYIKYFNIVQYYDDSIFTDIEKLVRR